MSEGGPENDVDSNDMGLVLESNRVTEKGETDEANLCKSLVSTVTDSFSNVRSTMGWSGNPRLSSMMVSRIAQQEYPITSVI